MIAYDPTRPITPTNFPPGFRFPPRRKVQAEQIEKPKQVEPADQIDSKPFYFFSR